MAKIKTKILFTASELTPFAKVGGLADVVGSLPKSLQSPDVDVKVVIPRYQQVNLLKIGAKKIAETTVLFGVRSHRIVIYATRLPRSSVTLWLIDQPEMLSRGEIYSNSDINFLVQRFIFFSSAVLATLPVLDYRPDLIHSHDWHTAAIPVMLSSLRGQNNPFFAETKTLLTIHNIQYQPIAGEDILKMAGLSGKNVNIFKRGLETADFINTVSPQYAKEIKSWAYGYGLEDIIKKRGSKVCGILNGIDTDVYDPETDKSLFKNFDQKQIRQRALNKSALQKQLGLPVSDRAMLVSSIGRLAAQKGVELIIESLKTNIEGLQYAILGSGDELYTKQLALLAKRYPKKIAFVDRFDSALGRQIYGGADVFMMPSLFEPCGLGQMIAMRYGNIPLARETGGLRDTVVNYDQKNGSGFLFKKFDAGEFIRTLKQAQKIYRFPRIWERIQKNAMKHDFSWKKSAGEYLKLYKKIISGK